MKLFFPTHRVFLIASQILGKKTNREHKENCLGFSSGFCIFQLNLTGASPFLARALNKKSKKCVFFFFSPLQLVLIEKKNVSISLLTKQTIVCSTCDWIYHFVNIKTWLKNQGLNYTVFSKPSLWGLTGTQWLFNWKLSSQDHCEDGTSFMAVYFNSTVWINCAFDHRLWLNTTHAKLIYDVR